MKAMILAAGRGTRVRPLTYAFPKPMIPIGHKPVMELLVEHLARHGFDQIMVNTSYLSPVIEGYFRDGGRFGVEMAYSFEGHLSEEGLVDAPVGSAGALRQIHDHSGFFDQTFVVLCGDAIIDLDLTQLVAQHRRQGALATIAVKRVPQERVASYGVVVTDPAGRVRSFQEKPSPAEARSTLANTGIYVFEPEILDAIPAGRTYDIGGELFPRLVEADAPVYAAELPFQWLDIGQTPDYYDVMQMALQGQVHNVTLPGTPLAEGLHVGLNVQLDPTATMIVPPVYIGGSAVVQPGSTIVGPAFIGPGCIIESGAHVERSIVFEYTRVGPGAYLAETLVCGGYCVSRNGAVIDLARADIGWVVTDARRPAADPAPVQMQIQEALRELGRAVPA